MNKNIKKGKPEVIFTDTHQLYSLSFISKIHRIRESMLSHVPIIYMLGSTWITYVNKKFRLGHHERFKVLIKMKVY